MKNGKTYTWRHGDFNARREERKESDSDNFQFLFPRLRYDWLSPCHKLAACLLDRSINANYAYFTPNKGSLPHSKGLEIEKSGRNSLDEPWRVLRIFKVYLTRFYPFKKKNIVSNLISNFFAETRRDQSRATNFCVTQRCTIIKSCLSASYFISLNRRFRHHVILSFFGRRRNCECNFNFQRLFHRREQVS